jgi:dihydropteroate synthase
VERALVMERDGADIIDIGAESTRPGAQDTPADEELRRLLPVMAALRGKLKIPISVDTRKAVVADAALRAGAEMVNDVSGLRQDPELAAIVARHKAPILLMHMRGEPATMQQTAFAKDVLAEVRRRLGASVAAAKKRGVRQSQILLDPGIGFGKSWRQNYELLARLEELAELGFPLVVGTSRKGFLGATLARSGKAVPSDQRAWATAATVTASILHGAHIVRVHDVAEMAQVARVADCIVRPSLAPRN